MGNKCELVVVMPVYNEEGCIRAVVDAWMRELSALRIDFRLLVLNDGSKDGTAAELAKLRDHPRLVVIDKPNSGHGPTILQGYREAVGWGEWVFQVDSDDELRPQDFADLWARRKFCDLGIGYRVNRRSPLSRRVITAGARLVVWGLFGSPIRDVNCPYRLFRAVRLRELLAHLPEDHLVPNVVLSGLAARKRLRIFQAPVSYQYRQTGVVSIRHWKLWKFAGRALLQTLRIPFHKPQPLPTATSHRRSA
jgi:glycosyltransferase involved in cell wall biosynthesis